MNELIGSGRGTRSPEPQDGRPTIEPMRPVMPRVLPPSEDLAMVAQRFAHRMPRLVRYLMEGLGTPDAQSADLMSYLLFDAAYTRALIDIGYRDAGECADEIELFLRAGRMEQPVPFMRAPGAPAVTKTDESPRPCTAEGGLG